MKQPLIEVMLGRMRMKAPVIVDEETTLRITASKHGSPLQTGSDISV